MQGWDLTHPFDRIAVLAETAGPEPYRAAACLLADEAREPPSFDGPDPCGDVDAPWIEPDFGRWGLSDGRTVNFVLPEGAATTVHAEARLGAGGPPLSSVSAKPVDAAVEFPTVELELPEFDADDCEVAFTPPDVTKADFVTTYDLGAICDANCSGDLGGTVRQGSDAIACATHDGKRVVRMDNGPGLACFFESFEKLVWRSDVFTASNCGILVEAHGRFATCRPGHADCDETAACQRPKTQLGIMNIDLSWTLIEVKDAAEAIAVDLDCVPRSLSPAVFYAKFDLVAGAGAVGFFAQEQADGDCFFELEQLRMTGITGQENCPPPPAP